MSLSPHLPPGARCAFSFDTSVPFVDFLSLPARWRILTAEEMVVAVRSPRANAITAVVDVGPGTKGDRLCRAKVMKFIISTLIKLVILKDDLDYQFIRASMVII